MKYITRTLKVLLLLIVIPVWWVVGIICILLSFVLVPLLYPIIYIVKGNIHVYDFNDFVDSKINQLFHSSFDFIDKILQE